MWYSVRCVLLLMFSVTCIASNVLAGNITVTGYLPRDLGEGVFDLDLVIAGISIEEHARGQLETGTDIVKFGNRVALKLPDIDSQQAVPVAKESATGLVKFYAEERQIHTEELDSATNTYTYSYFVKVIETEAGTLAAKAAGGTLKISAFFYLGSQSQTVVAKIEGQSLTQDAYVLAEVPSFDATTPIVGSMNSLTVSWQTKSEVNVKSTKDSDRTKKPRKVHVYTVASGTVSQALPAKKFSGSATTADSAATCNFTAPADEGGSCVSCSADGDYYLDPEQIGSISGFKVTSFDQSQGSGVITGLTNDQRYFVFLQYDPDGLTPSTGQTCLPAVPSANVTMTELNGEDTGKVVDLRCFIATAAYGSPLHHDLQVFRKFRDQVLLRSYVGRAVVRGYYRVSPVLAQFISKHETMRRYVRSGLEKLAVWLRD